MAHTGILGGTFNPVHHGHLRLALEVGEALQLQRVLLTPCAVPPHKSGQGILPFALRAELLRVSLEGSPRLGLNTLEGEMSGPSYTYLSLREWSRRNGERPCFLMGVEDFACLDSWYRGLELPLLAQLVVVPRAGSDWPLFRVSLNRFWPGNLAENEPTPAERRLVALRQGGDCLFLPAPRLDISATFLRRRWLEGRDIRGLIPDAACRLLSEHEREVRAAWARQADERTVPYG